MADWIVGNHRIWLARKLLDASLSDEEAYRTVANSPAISDAAPMEPVAWREKVFAIVEPLVLGLATEFSYAERRAFADKKTDAILQALVVIPTEGLGSSATPIPTCDAEIERLKGTIELWETGRLTLERMPDGRPCIMHHPEDPNAEVRDPDTGEVIFPATKAPFQVTDGRHDRD